MTDDLIARLEDESARCNEYQTQRQLEDTEAERDRLRALLRDIRDNGINAPMEDRIDAALKDAP